MPFTLSPRKPSRRADPPRPQRGRLRAIDLDPVAEAEAEAPALRTAAPPPRPAPAPVTEDDDRAVPGDDRPRGSFRDFKAALRVWLTGIAPGRTSAADLAQKVGEEAVAAYQRSALTLEQLQYRAVDARGFIGYRFGEELLETLGYYRPTPQALAQREALARMRPEESWSRVANRWDGHFTGLQGAFSLKDFATPGVQEIAIGEAFALHLQRIIGLLPGEMGLGDVVGIRRELDPPPRSRGIGRTGVDVAVSGILAAAQVYGPEPVANYLLGGASHKDEVAQGIHRLMSEFAGYATPYDTIPQPSDSDVGHLIARVRGGAQRRSNPFDDPDWLR